ncbi:nitroreductase family protein [Jeotgalibaca ciconiae]|uniref:Nitroreductase domain-containing protein n=1 Tax=Jeotgalibaca ciconiae TaxID=2496265 RepID=A0A3S9HBB9_9LACT|nr:nitroreductase family protein [Jeotgalibaca ciconiae]AZP04627.1 hypothetical protein EJN90_08265 [Jeotgalibaca ciconiae]HJB23124.1 nitroreductase family protein [Candidatus Jeotgalibaca pullicola]
MEFEKVLIQNHPCERFMDVKLTNAQIESVVKAGQSAPILDDLRENFHIAVIRSERALHLLRDSKKEIPEDLVEEMTAGGPVYFIVSVKDHKLAKESIYLYAGIIMGNMQLQATSIFLGYNFASEQKKVELIDTLELKEKLGIPAEFEPVQILKVGYTEEDIKNRKISHGEVFTKIIS